MIQTNKGINLIKTSSTGKYQYNLIAKTWILHQEKHFYPAIQVFKGDILKLHPESTTLVE